MGSSAKLGKRRKEDTRNEKRIVTPNGIGERRIKKEGLRVKIPPFRGSTNYVEGVKEKRKGHKPTLKKKKEGRTAGIPARERHPACAAAKKTEGGARGKGKGLDHGPTEGKTFSERHPPRLERESPGARRPIVKGKGTERHLQKRVLARCLREKKEKKP